MKNEFIDYFISIITGCITATSVGLYSVGSHKIVIILMHGTFIDFGLLCLKTVVLATLGGFGGLFAKAIWEKLNKKENDSKSKTS